MPITHDQLKHLFPRATAPVLKAFAGAAPGVLSRFDMDARPSRTEYFLAQIGHESCGLTVFEERLNYSAARLCAVWPKRFATAAAAQSFANNPRRLANRVYADRMGNGDEASGDGYNYRGRGAIQITGRDGYRNVGRRVGIDLERNPNLASEPDTLLLVAAGFWAWKGLNDLCDADDFAGATRRINGGTIGLEERRAWLERARRALAPSPWPTAQAGAARVRAAQGADAGVTATM